MLTLPSQMLAQTPLTPNFPVRELALGTPSLSGSDLKELCRNAAMVGLRQSMRELQASGADLSLTAKNAPSVSLPHIVRLCVLQADHMG